MGQPSPGVEPGFRVHTHTDKYTDTHTLILNIGEIYELNVLDLFIGCPSAYRQVRCGVQSGVGELDQVAVLRNTRRHWAPGAAVERLTAGSRAGQHRALGLQGDRSVAQRLTQRVPELPRGMYRMTVSWCLGVFMSR